MNWSGYLLTSITNAYSTVTEWCFNHQTATDAIIGVAVLGSLLYFARNTLRARRLLHRIRWGTGMKKSKNREAFERGLISFGICDSIEEAVFRGDMTRERANHWYQSFADDYAMSELIPRKLTKEDIKQNINRRIQLWERLKIIIPGALPGVKVDGSYNPPKYVPSNVIVMAKKGLSRSKYSKAS